MYHPDHGLQPNLYEAVTIREKLSGHFSKTGLTNLRNIQEHGYGERAKYRKIPKISPGAYIFQRPFLRGLSAEGNLHFKIDGASLINGRKFTVFASFYLYI